MCGKPFNFHPQVKVFSFDFLVPYRPDRRFSIHFIWGFLNPIKRILIFAFANFPFTPQYYIPSIPFPSPKFSIFLRK